MSNKITFYVCSFGGCGSTMLAKYLSNFGNVEHIHSRNPPNLLSYVGNKNTTKNAYKEWFNEVQISNENLKNYKVIFIYKNPLNAIYSRFVTRTGPHVQHLQHIQCDNNGFIRLMDVINTKKDLYKIEEFFDNYTTKKERNYNIYCVKYENFWENIETFNKILEIPDMKQLYPIKQETTRHGKFNTELTEIYKSLIDKMNSKDFIEII